MEVRGSVDDRPWGLTLGAIAVRSHTGQLTVDSDGKRYSIAFDRGAIVAASSPAAADAIARVALTNHLITRAQVPDITRRLAHSPDRDEIEVLSEVIRFTPDQAFKLRHRLVAQRAARTFSLERGDFVLDDRIALPMFPDLTVDHRHVIYLGVRNLSEQRLLDDLRQLGSSFVLKPEAIGELPRFGFEPHAHPVLEALRLGTSLPELEASHREIDPRLAQEIIYALVSCTACTILPRTATATASGSPSPARALPPLRDVTARIVTRPDRPPAGDAAGKPPATAGSPTSPPRASSTSTVYSGLTSADAGTNTPAATRPRALSDARTPQPATPTPDPAAPPGARAPAPATAVPGPSAIQTLPPARSAARPPTSPPPLVAARAETQDSGKFAAIPTPSRAAGTSPTSSRPAMPRVVTPTDAELRGFSDQRTPSGFGEQRTPSGQRTPTDPAAPRPPTGSPLSSRVSAESATAAEETFKRGELAMKRDQPGEAILEFKAACDLNPQEVDYAGMLAWAKFCAAGDKAAIGAETRKVLERVAYKSNRPERARFYLGRVERMLGRDREALRHFQEVLDLKPNHAEAASEVRAIEARLQAGSKTGRFGRKR